MKYWFPILWWALWGIVIFANIKSDGKCIGYCPTCVYHLNCPQEKGE